MMFKKGQAAMEFLMTYGWAILVVLIAIGALAYFGVLNPNKLIADRCTISTGSGVFCDDFNAIAAGPTVNLNVRNANSNAINITYVNFSYNNLGNSCGYGTAVSTSTFSTVVQPDQVTSFNISKNNNGASTVGNCALTAGTKAKGDLTINYNVIGSSLSKTTTGSLVVTPQ